MRASRTTSKRARKAPARTTRRTPSAGSAPTRTADPAVAVGGLVLALLLGACGGPGTRWSTTWRAPYGALDGSQRAVLADARSLEVEGRRLEALAKLEDLRAASPQNLEVAVMAQDLEESLLHDGVDVFAPGHSLVDLEPDDVLRVAYSARSDADPTVASFVLAARAETDGFSAKRLLERAIELDPTCAWAHYGLSHLLLEDRTRVDRWSLARQSLERALALDGGHVRARRLEAWMAAEEGSRSDAEALLVRWIEEVEGDPRVTDDERVEARLDLALLLLLRGEDGQALRQLEDLEGTRHDRARRLMLLTVAREEAGDALGALDAAVRAQGAAEGRQALPLVQEALLLELLLDRPEEAEQRWRAVAELADGAANLADLIQGLRARVRLERGGE